MTVAAGMRSSDGSRSSRRLRRRQRESVTSRRQPPAVCEPHAGGGGGTAICLHPAEISLIGGDASCKEETQVSVGPQAESARIEIIHSARTSDHALSRHMSGSCSFPGIFLRTLSSFKVQHQRGCLRSTRLPEDMFWAFLQAVQDAKLQRLRYTFLSWSQPCLPAWKTELQQTHWSCLERGDTRTHGDTSCPMVSTWLRHRAAGWCRRRHRARPARHVEIWLPAATL